MCLHTGSDKQYCISCTPQAVHGAEPTQSNAWLADAQQSLASTATAAFFTEAPRRGPTCGGAACRGRVLRRCAQSTAGHFRPHLAEPNTHSFLLLRRSLAVSLPNVCLGHLAWDRWSVGPLARWRAAALSAHLPRRGGRSTAEEKNMCGRRICKRVIGMRNMMLQTQYV